MQQPPSRPTDPTTSETRRVFRQPAMLASAALLVVVLVVLLIGLVDADGLSAPAELLWPIGSILLVWVVFVRPCVELDQGGLTLRNVLRDVRLTWPAVDVIEQRWSLKVYTADDVGYGSWAIASQRPQKNPAASPRRGLGSLTGGLQQPAAPDTDTPDAVVARRGSAADVAAVIDRSRSDYIAAVELDQSLTRPASVERRYVPAAVAATAVGIVFILASFFWG